MQKIILALALLFCCNPVALAGPQQVFGKIELVNAMADYRVKIVDTGADLDVEIVNALASRPGQWQIVNSMADFKVQIVQQGQDFTIRLVNSPAGLR